MKTDIYKDSVCPDGIDAVWLWVNGTDPKFLEELAKHGRKGGAGRYRDYNTLQYSIRSVWKFAPFIKNYYIVTMNQIPSFLNPQKFKYKDYTLKIIDHKDIFPNKTDLPVFNSNALEVSIHNIPGLRSCFLYLNDDMMLGKELNPSHFITSDGLLNVYHNSWKAPEEERMKKNLWHRSVGYSNRKINELFHPNEGIVKHPYVSHHCYFFKTDILREMEQKFQDRYVFTRKNKFRHGEDLAIPFQHGAYATESGKGKYVKEYNYYYGLVDNNTTNINKIINGIKKKNPQCICLNDGLDEKKPEQMNKAVNMMTDFLRSLIPKPCPFELFD